MSKMKPQKTQRWTRSDTLALALDSCTTCRGVGICVNARGKMRPCNCVLRTIFRVCYKRFVHEHTREKMLAGTRSDLSRINGAHSYNFCRPSEEFIADFYLVSKRTLSAEEWALFKYHFLLGADWKACCKRLKLDRGEFFHAVYRIEQKLGRKFKELEPYALFPLDTYFTNWQQPTEEPIEFEADEFEADDAEPTPRATAMSLFAPLVRQGNSRV
jgi:hypothetical protein